MAQCYLHSHQFRMVTDKKSGIGASVRAALAGARVRAAAARANGHLRADAAAPRSRLAHAQEAARAPEAAGQGVSEGADGTRRQKTPEIWYFLFYYDV